MTVCMFESNSEAESRNLLGKIWEVIKDWEEFAGKEVSLCKTINEYGEYYVYLTVDDIVRVSVSLCFNASENTGKYYELKLEKSEAYCIQVPVDVKARIYYERPAFENGSKE